MAEIEKSVKLVFNEFQRSITEVPLEVYYQEISSDQYSSSGFQFNVKQPGINALLDPDIWIKYPLYLRSTLLEIENMVSGRTANPLNSTSIPANTHRFALRGGNIVAKSLQNLSVQINNSTLNVQPYRFLPILDRIYISNDQSEHEFSASGGRFDEGNHGHRDTNSYAVSDDLAPTVVVNNNPVVVHYADGFYPYAPIPGGGVVTNIRRPYPLQYEWYNPGFSRRVEKFFYNLRSRYAAPREGTNIISPHPADALIATNAANGAMTQAYLGREIAGAAGTYEYTIEVWERLPIPIFKMYSTDAVFGAIPNIVQMQIQGNFLTNLLQNAFCCNDLMPNTSLQWNDVATSSGKLYLRWYTPPVNFSVPKEISLPYPKINTWSTTQTITPFNAGVVVIANHAAEFIDSNFSQYNITLEAIPDLLLIYVRYAPFSQDLTTPDDYCMELLNLVLNIDNASGKLNQCNSMDYYLKWKKLIKHSDAKIIGYDEWRKYCFVACLQPEDYGVRFGPGYSNQTTLGISGIARNWHNSPSVIGAESEPLGAYEGAARGAGNKGELFITTIYNKNRFVIRADGSAGQEMVKMAADFNMISPQTPASV